MIGISRVRSKLRQPATAMAAAALGLACATSPLGRSQFILMPEAQMEQMGLAAFDQLKRERPLSKDSAAASYVQCVASAVTRGIRQLEGLSPEVRVPARWEVQLFQDDSANAFALPGGKIGVHTGLLKVARTSGQLAAVLGHEVGHVLARHSNERYSQQTAAQLGLMTAGAAIGAIGESGSTNQQLVYQALGVGTQLGLLSWSREQESEADGIGIDMMALAGFDPAESIELWKNMERASKGQPPEFLSTHPSHGTRIHDLQMLLPKEQAVWKRTTAQGRRPNCAVPGAKG
jgi:predicted Zn-dependent protease